MRQLQLIAHGEPSDVIELNTVSEPALGQEDVLISMEAAPLNPSDFLFASRTAVYGPVRTVVWQGSAGNRCPMPIKSA
jgi:NADPH:quinone reductase-like Zn-dependent oxidoreductase